MYEYDLFVSHASKDKMLLATPLVEALQDRGLSIWYDTFEIQLGASITDKINEGLRKSRYTLVLISAEYARSEWARQELNAVFKKQVLLQEKQILPVWFDFSFKDIIEYYPLLLDYKALQITKEYDLDRIVSVILDTVLEEADDENF